MMGAATDPMDVWERLHVNMQDLGHSVERLQSMVGAMVVVETQAYVANVELIPTAESALADARMLAVVLGYVEEWLGHVTTEAGQVQAKVLCLLGDR